MQRACLLPLLAFTVFALATLQTKRLCADVSPKPSQQAVDFFEKKIRPVLIKHCYECHSADANELEGGLMLDNQAAIANGGDSGKVLMPSDPDGSRLLVAMKYDDESLQMPPAGKLPDQVLADFEKWIRDGAIDPRDGPAPPPPDSIEARSRKHWAFNLPENLPRPEVKDTAWPREDIDYFVLSKLEDRGITPAEQAQPRNLIRRLYYDLTGLPPTFEEVAAFETDASDEAYEKLVDHLLSTEQFGERWARHWLDVARFGDTKGYVFQEDRNYPNAYKYRDWVIDAFNTDMPYDDFLKFQLAADHFASQDDRSQLAALGFLTLGRRFINNAHDIIDDRIDVVFRGTMGLTLGCSRCHDHKYDPVSMNDYYGMYGVFSSTDEKQDDDLPLRLVDKAKPHNVGIFLRGNAASRGEIAPRQYLSFFAGNDAKPFERGSGRAELAEAIASRDNPLTARVAVNRVWGHLFGTPLVRTPSDFGLRSDLPMQREVLDQLASSFMDNGWSVKKLIRSIVMSSVYQQSSEIRLEAVKIDPENELLWRAERRRLDFEAMRDSLLAVSGQLDRTVRGPSVKIANESPSKRRTLYAFIDRQNLPGLFRTFDFASPDTHSPKRPETTVPQQALYLLNNNFVQTAAESLIQRIDKVESNEDRIESLYKIALSRTPRKDELKLALDFISTSESAQFVPAGNPWQFGYGNVEEDSQRVDFHRMSQFVNQSWQGGPELPDPKTGWSLVRKAGGHAGNDQAHASIRRWYAQADGTIVVTGTLEHPSDQGDGVRGRIVSSRDGVVGEWTAQHSDVPTECKTTLVKRGDTIDFVVDCRTNPSFDSFVWKATIRQSDPTNEQTLNEWNTEDGFHGPLPKQLGAWQRLAQTLMLTNEFMFLD